MAATSDTSGPDARVRWLYGVALITALGGLFFLFVRDFWMTGASLALSVGSAMLAWGTEWGSKAARWGGYACMGAAAALLIIDALQSYVL